MDVVREVLAAEERIRPHVRVTPVEQSPSLSRAADAQVALKLECFQLTGSFKLRGAMSKVASLSSEAPTVVAASSGNHGAGVAYAAATRGGRAIVFVPEGASPTKVEAIEAYGAEVRYEGTDSVISEHRARSFAEQEGLTYVSPYNDPAVVGGQGTIGLELSQQLETIDTIYIALGGGGLTSGVAGYLKSVNPRLEVVACSPENSKVMAESVAAGRVLELESQPTLSDGTAGGVELDAITFDLCSALVDRFVMVSEEEIRQAMRLLIARHHVLVEGSAGVRGRGLPARKTTPCGTSCGDHPVWREHRAGDPALRALGDVMQVIELDRIREALKDVDVLEEVAAGFVAYSRGEAVVPPVGELTFEDPPGDVHIKYGYLQKGQGYVIKIASGFYDNPKRGLPSSNGMMLVFDQQTGQPSAVLLDEGHLTDTRTAAAGALATRCLAPDAVRKIGILGTGIQARLQLEHLRAITRCRSVLAWGRGEDQLESYRRDVEPLGFEVETTRDATEVAERCNLIVTTTPSNEPLLRADWIRPGTHLSAVGSDTAEKQELEAEILARADLVVADSIPQCRERGEISHALAAGLVAEDDLVELGSLLAGDAPGRTDPAQITVADLTGVAVQDIQIATAVVRALSSP